MADCAVHHGIAVLCIMAIRNELVVVVVKRALSRGCRTEISLSSAERYVHTHPCPCCAAPCCVPAALCFAVSLLHSVVLCPCCTLLCCAALCCAVSLLCSDVLCCALGCWRWHPSAPRSSHLPIRLAAQPCTMLRQSQGAVCAGMHLAPPRTMPHMSLLLAVPGPCHISRLWAVLAPACCSASAITACLNSY